MKMGFSVSREALLTVFAVICGAPLTSAWTFWQAPPTSASCTSNVPFADTQNCTSYYQCFRVNALWQLVHLSCPTGGIWDDVYKACVEGSCGATTAPPPPSSSPLPTQPPPTSAAPTSKPPPPPPSPTPMKTNPPRVTTSTTTRRPPPVTSPAPPPSSGDPCPRPGFFPDPANCRAYYRCLMIRGRFYRYGFLCPYGSSWHSASRGCVLGKCQKFM